MLGEILTSAVAGLASEPLSGLTLSVGLVAVVVGFGAWWTYFDFTGQRQPKPTRPATAQWVLGHLPLTASIAAMGAATVSLINHAHDNRTPVATAWVTQPCTNCSPVRAFPWRRPASGSAPHGLRPFSYAWRSLSCLASPGYLPSRTTWRKTSGSPSK